jgi:hypothetical protein
MGYSGDALAGAMNRFGVMGIASLPAPMQTLYQEQANTAAANAKAAQTSAGAEASRAATERQSLQGYDTTQDGKKVHVQGSAESVMSAQAIQLKEQQVQMAKVEAVMNTQEQREIVAGYASAATTARAHPSKANQENLEFWEDKLVDNAGGVVTKEEVHHWFSPNEIRSTYSWPSGSTQAPALTDNTSGAPGAP